MSNLGPIIADVGDKVAGDFVKGFGRFITEETGGFGYVRSTKALLNKTTIGKVFGEYLENTFEPKVRQMGQQILENKIATGVPKPQAAKESVRDAWRLARQTYLGQNDEALIKFIHSASKQHGTIYGNAVADAMSVYFHDSASYWRRTRITDPSNLQSRISLKDVEIKAGAEFRNPSELEGRLRRALSWMYTPLIAIPHTAQVGNIVLDNVNTPIKAVARGLSEYFSSGVTKDKFTADLIRSGALFDEIRYNIMEDAASQGKAGIFYKLFNHPGFGFVRRQEIAMAAAIGKHAALEAADRLSANATDKWANYSLQKLGIETSKLAERGYKLTDDEIRKAMYTEAERTIFFRNQLKTPWRWEENFVARLGSQYRHFQFRQTQFLVEVFKDSYKEAGAVGLAKTIAIFATLFPVFGEIVHSVENLTVGKNLLERDPKSQFGNEYTDALAHAAGFGVFYSIARSGMWNGGRGFLEGPLLTTIEDVLIGIPTDYAHGRFKTGTRKLVSKFGVPGRLVSEQMKDKKD